MEVGCKLSALERRAVLTTTLIFAPTTRDDMVLGTTTEIKSVHLPSRGATLRA